MESKGQFQLQSMTQSRMILREKQSMMLKKKNQLRFEFPPPLSHIQRHLYNILRAF